MIKHWLIFLILLQFPVINLAQKNQLDHEGKRHGFWKVYFEDTQNPKFEGNFEHGQEIGTFKFYKEGFYEHPSAIMNFEKGKDSVQVTYYTQKGKPISEGKMVNRKREGQWVYYHQQSDSIMMSEVYKNDTLHGIQKTYFPNGIPAEKTSYSNGLKHGESFIYNDNGQVSKQLNYKYGELHGEAVYYNLKGEKTIEGWYTEGRKSGNWKYYKDGKLEREQEY